MPISADNTVFLQLNHTIVLVGIMGSGKTSVGKRLASILGAKFHDSDHEIEEAAGMKVAEIFERFGEDYFRDGERRVIARLLDAPPCVLATGGGAFVSEENRRIIAKSGTSIWLKAELETLWDRVKDRSTRPLLQQPNPKQVLKNLMEKRHTAYQEATLIVSSDPGISHDIMVRRILETIREHDLAHPSAAPILTKKAVE